MLRLKITVVALALAAGLAAGAVATAASGWRVFATASDSGTYGAFASASVQGQNALALRVSAPADVTWSIYCDGVAHTSAGQVLTLAVTTAAKCNVTGSASRDGGGTVRVQLLRR